MIEESAEGRGGKGEMRGEEGGERREGRGERREDQATTTSSPLSYLCAIVGCREGTSRILLSLGSQQQS